MPWVLFKPQYYARLYNNIKNGPAVDKFTLGLHIVSLLVATMTTTALATHDYPTKVEGKIILGAIGGWIMFISSIYFLWDILKRTYLEVLERDNALYEIALGDIADADESFDTTSRSSGYLTGPAEHASNPSISDTSPDPSRPISAASGYVSGPNEPENVRFVPGAVHFIPRVVHFAPAAARDVPVAAPDDPIAAPIYPIAAPDNSVAAPDNSVAAPGDSIAAPGDSIAAPDDSIAAPIDSRAASGNAEASPAASVSDAQDTASEDPEVVPSAICSPEFVPGTHESTFILSGVKSCVSKVINVVSQALHYDVRVRQEQHIEDPEYKSSLDSIKDASASVVDELELQRSHQQDSEEISYLDESYNSIDEMRVGLVVVHRSVPHQRQDEQPRTESSVMQDETYRTNSDDDY